MLVLIERWDGAMVDIASIALLNDRLRTVSQSITFSEFGITL